VAGLLGISKGSASQSLRFLQEIHAVEVSYPGHRRPTYYKVEISLRRLVAGLVQSRIDPRLGGD
jgi:DNA-binding transcriptional regulator GbsR (MarR family)